MIEKSYTMRCDGCQRYLQDDQQTTLAYGSRLLLVAEARRLGWWVNNVDPRPDDRHWCPSCQEHGYAQP